jgi:hypothetical protein
MTASSRIGLRIAGFSLITIVLLYISLFFAFQSAPFRAWTQTEMSRRSGLDIEMGSLRLGFPFRVIAENVRLSAPLFAATAARLSATFNPLELPAPNLHRLTIDRPILRLDLNQLTGPADEGKAPWALRRLNVRQGTVVLTRGEENFLELPNIDLQAENINLGGQSGLTLSADVPALDAVAELVVKGHARELETALVLRAKPGRTLLGVAAAKSSTAELLRLEGKFRAPERRPAEATLTGKFYRLGSAESKFTGTLAAQVEFDTGFHAADFSAKATLADFPGALVPAMSKLPRGKAQTSFSGEFSLRQKILTLKAVELFSHLGNAAGEAELLFDPEPHISRANFRWHEMPLDSLKALLPEPLSRWIYGGQARIEGEMRGPWAEPDIRGIARGEKIQVLGDRFKTAARSVVLPFAWLTPGLRVDGAKLDLVNIDYGGWQASAKHLQASASAALQADRPSTIHGRFETAGGKFNSPGNNQIGENLALSGSFEWVFRPKTNSHGLNAKLGFDGGDILWNQFFTDLKARKPSFAFDADYFRADDRLECRTCEITIADVGTVSASGTVEKLTEKPELRLQTRSARFRPGGLFEYFRENLNRRWPFLDRIALGGELAFAARLHGHLDDLGAVGELSLKNGELRSRSDAWQVGPLTLQLPFDLGAAESKAVGGPRTGTLAIERARFGEQSLAPIRASLSLSRNALRFHQPVRAALFGGEIIVRDLSWPDVIRDPKRLSFSLEADKLELTELTEALDWPRFSGTLTGSIPEVQSTADALKTSGGLQAELFGGRITMNRLEIEDPFSPLAAIRLNADLTNIQLERLSQTFAFGHISGILAGTIDDLVIIDRQPAQFRANLYSVDRGGEQRISVEALNKITVLSSGQSAGALYGGLAGFFDSFRYSKLGFKAQLKNDRLTLRGVESRGDQEYLVVGSFLPPTVNIVSHTQVIAFSELLRRLERIKSERPQVK